MQHARLARALLRGGVWSRGTNWATNLHRRDASPSVSLRYSVRAAFKPCREPMAHRSQAKDNVAATAKLLVVLLAFAWGFNWIAAAVALREVSPWSLRFAGSGIGTATLFAAAILTGHNLRVPRGEHVHVMVAGFFNVAAFQILSGFAQLSGATSRAIIITYSMPIWTTMLSYHCARRTADAGSYGRIRAMRGRFSDPGVAAVRRPDFRFSCSIRSAAR